MPLRIERCVIYIYIYIYSSRNGSSTSKGNVLHHYMQWKYKLVAFHRIRKRKICVHRFIRYIYIYINIHKYIFTYIYIMVTHGCFDAVASSYTSWYRQTSGASLLSKPHVIYANIRYSWHRHTHKYIYIYMYIYIIVCVHKSIIYIYIYRVNDRHLHITRQYILTLALIR